MPKRAKTFGGRVTTPAAAPRSPRSGTQLALGLGVGLTLSASLSAQFVWDGGAATGNWSDALNWSTDTVPPASAAAIQFAGTVQTTVDLQADRSIASLAFNSGASPFTVANHTLTFTGAGTVLTNNSASTQTITSGLQFTASQTISAASGPLVLGGPVALSNSAANHTLTFSAAQPITVTGIIANGGTSTASGITKTGAAVLTLSGLNTYGGATAIQAGTLSVNSLANLSTASALGAPTTIAAGTITLGSGTGTGTLLYTGGTTSTDRVINLAGTTGGAVLDSSGTGAITFTSAFTTTGAGSKTLTLRGTNTDANTLAGAIVNNSATNLTSILKTDTGLWVLSGPNTYTGTTTVNNGTLRLGSSSSLAPTAVTVNATSPGATALLDLNGYDATVASLTFGGSSNTSQANVATGSGTLTLAGNVTYVGTNNPLGSVLSGNLALGAVTRTFNIGNSTAADDLTVTAAISGLGGLTKAGTGTLVLSGTNTYGGPTTINAGTLRLDSAAALPAGTALTIASNASSTTALLDLNGFNYTATSLTFGGAGGTTTSTGNLATGSGTLTLAGNVAYLATGNPLGSTLSGNLSLGSANRTFTVGDSTTATNDLTVSAVVSGTGGLIKTDTGTLALSGLNTYTGPTSIQGGVLSVNTLGNLAAASALGAPTTVADGTIRIGSTTTGGTLLYTGGTASTNRVIDLAGTTGGATLNVSGTGPLTFTSNFTASGAGAKTLTLRGTSTAANTVAGLIVDHDAANRTSLAKFDAGLWVLSAANTFSGSTSIGGGTLSVNSLADLGVASALGAPVTVGDGTIRIGSTTTAGTLLYTGGTASTNRVIDLAGTTGGATVTASGTGPLTFTSNFTASGAGAKTLTLRGTNTAANTVAGLIVDHDAANRTSLAKLDAGVWVLSAANTFSGSTTISGGTLSVNSLANLGVASALGAPTTVADGTINIGSGTTAATLLYTGAGATTDRVIRLAGSSGGATITSSGTGALIFTSDTSAAAGSKSLTLRGANTDANTFSGVIANGPTGAVGVTKADAGTWILSGANTYTGATTVSAGTLRATNASALGAGTLAVGTATLQLAGDSGLVFGRNTAASGVATFQIDRLTSGAAVTHSLGTLAIGSATLAVTPGANVTSGVAGLVFGATTVTSSATINTAANTHLTFGPFAFNSSSTRTLTKAGEGTLLLSAASPSSWATTHTVSVTRGTLLFGANNVFSDTSRASLSLNASAAGANVLVDLAGYNQSFTNLTFAGASPTSVANLSTGAGLLTLNGNVTYTSTGNPLGSTLSGNVALAAGTRTFTIGDSLTAPSDLSVTALISGAGSLLKTGTGTLTLSGANTYTGRTFINAGVLSVNSLADLSAASALGAPTTVADGTINIGLTNTTATLLYTGTGSTTNRVVNLAGTTGGAVLNSSGTGALVFTSPFTTTGAGSKLLTLRGTNPDANRIGAVANGPTGVTSLLKTDAGTWVLGGVNTYTGTTTINNGTLRLGVNNALSVSAVTLNATSAGATAILDLDGFDASVTALTFGGTGSTATSTTRVTTGAGTLTLGGNVTYNSTGNALGSTISGNLALGAATRTFTVNDSLTAAEDLAISAAISGTGGLTKAGTGTLVLSGDNAYTGNTTVSTGTLRATTSANALGAGNLILSGGSLQLAGDTGLAFGRATSLTSSFTVTSDRLTPGAGVTHSLGSLTLGSVTLGLASGSNVTSGVAGLTFGPTTLTGNSTFSTAANTALTLGALTATSARTITKSGAGTLVFSAAADTLASGQNLVVSNGTARLAASDALGATALTNVTVNATVSGATARLDLDGRDQSILSLTFGGTGATATSTNLVSTGTGTLTLGGNVTSSATNNPLGATLSGNVALGAATRTFSIADSTNAAADLTVSAAISGTSGLTKTGAGTLVFSGANTYSGLTTVSTGTLRAGAADTFSTASAHSVAAAATLDLADFDQTVGSLTGAGFVTLGTATLTTGDDDSSTTFSGVISGDGGLTKSGAGTFTLAGANTYLGATTVSEGTLTLAASDRIAPSSALSVGAAGTFDLAGFNQTIGALSGSGTVQLGAGTLSTDALTDSTFAGDLSGTGTFLKTGATQLTLTGASTFTGNLVLDDGSITLSGATGSLAAAGAVTVNAGATLHLDNSAASLGDRLNDAAPLNLAGGTLAFTSAAAGTSESVGLLNAGAGLSTITVNQSGVGAAVLTFAGVGVIDPDATVDFTSTGGPLGVSASGPQIYIGGLSTGFIGGWAVVGSDFAEYASFGVRALGGYYTGLDGINVNDPTRNIILTSSSPDTAYTLTNAGTTTDQSLLVGDIALIDLNTSATRTLNLASGGLLKVSATDTVISGEGRLTAANTANGTLFVTVQSTGSLTIDSVILNNAGTDSIYGNAGDGVVRVTKAGAGELILGAANLHSGGTQLDAGTLTLRHDSAAGTGSLVLNGGTLRAASGDRVVANNVTLGGNVTFASPDSSALAFSGSATLTGNRTLTVNSATTFSGVIGETGGARTLTKNGSAILTLAGGAANTFTGVTTVNAGELHLAKSSGNAIAGNLVIGDTIDADTVRLFASNQISDTSAVTVRTGGLLDLNGFNDTIGSLTIAGGSAITTGAGTLTLGGNVTYSGAITTATATITGRLSLGASTRTFTIPTTVAATGLDVSAVISGSGGLTKAGAGTLALSAANTYTGATTITAGTLRTDVADAISASSAVVLSSGATLNLNNHNQSVGSLAGAGSVVLGSALLGSGADDTSTTFSGTISGSGGLAKNGTGTLTLDTAHTYTGAVLVNAGTLRLENASALGTTAGGVTVASGATLALDGGLAIGAEALALSGTLQSVSGDNSYAGGIALSGSAAIAADTASLALTGTVSGTGGFTFTGDGTLRLSGANTYAGSTTVSSGTLQLTHASALGATSGGTVVASGATLVLEGGLAVGAESLTLGGTLQSLSGVNSYAGDLTLSAPALVRIEADSFTLSGGLDTAGHIATFSSVGDASVSGAISGAGGITKTDAGTLTLSGTSTYAGLTTVSAGTLRITHGSALGSTAAGTVLADGTTLALSGGIAVGAESLTLSGSGDTGASGALVNLSGDNAFAGTITLVGDTTFSSESGRLDLDGTISTAGHELTFVGAGDFGLGANIGTSFTKTGDGTLYFTAAQSITGTVVLAGGTLHLGDLDHAITSLNVTADSVLDFGAGASRLDLSTLFVDAGATLTILNWTDLVDFFSAATAPGPGVLGRVVFTPFDPEDTKYNDFTDEITPVPEPSTYGLLTVGFLTALAITRRRRRHEGKSLS